MAKITERGWSGHFICADRCLFRRNTLIEGDKDSVVVSTVGGMRPLKGKGLETIGAGGRYYETMVFGAHKDGEYIEANISDERGFESEWAICAERWEELPEDVDNRANEQHEAVVSEFAKAICSTQDNDLSKGVWFKSSATGMYYRNHGACGDVSEVLVDGKTYRLPWYEEAVMR